MQKMHANDHTPGKRGKAVTSFKTESENRMLNRDGQKERGRHQFLKHWWRQIQAYMIKSWKQSWCSKGTQRRLTSQKSLIYTFTGQTARRKTNEKTWGSYKTTCAKKFQIYSTLLTGSAVSYCQYRLNPVLFKLLKNDYKVDKCLASSLCRRCCVHSGSCQHWANWECGLFPRPQL